MFATFNGLGTPDPVSGKPQFYHTFMSGLLAGSIGAYIATPLGNNIVVCFILLNFIKYFKFKM